MYPDTSFEIFRTLTFSWEFFRQHTGFGLPNVYEYEPGGLLVREFDPKHPAYSIQPWISMVPDQYRVDIMSHFAIWSLTLERSDYSFDKPEEFKFRAYNSFVGLTKDKLMSGEWPTTTREIGDV